MSNIVLDRFVTPRGFWDTTLTGNAIGLAMIIILWWNAPAEIELGYFAGVLFGLLIGHVFACVVELSGNDPKSRFMPRSIYFFVNIGLLLFIGYLSRRMLFGYFAGLGITFSFETAFAELVKRSLQRRNPEASKGT